ncbi:MAG: chromosomal replication initiator protein DnaA [Dehalococcoidia bacterium]|nr:chromosomal replication initiator protein DnaA [Dehalococcoidia bacterium]
MGRKLESARDIWVRVLGELQVQVNKANYNTWLRDSEGISYEDNVFVVSVPNVFIAEWVSQRLSSLIEKSLSNIVGSDVSIQIEVRCHEPKRAEPPICSYQTDGGTSSKIRKRGFNPRYTFDNLVVSDYNHLAVTAAREAVDYPGQAYNPLYIYSDTGQGKTHLLHAIGQEAKSKGIKAIYIAAESFTSEFVLAVRQKEVEAFRSKFRDVQIVLFDDMQFICDKKQCLQCFLQIFKELYSNEQQIVITADCHPREVSSLDDKLKSRLQSGLVTSISCPDFETRLEILHAKAEALEVAVTEEALQIIAGKTQGSIRELEGALTYCATQARLSGTDITKQTVNNFLTGNNNNHGDSIISTVVNYFNLPAEEIKGRKRSKEVVLARHIVMYLMREENGSSFTEIGRTLGNRNHATAIYGYNKIASELNINSTLCQQIAYIREQLRPHKF